MPSAQAATGHQPSLPGENASSEAREQGVDKEEEEEEGPLATFRKRRIAFRTLPRPFQALLLLTLVQIGAVALLLATQNLPQPQVFSGVLDAKGQHYVVPLAAFIVLVVSLTTATWFALAGALRVHWSLRWPVIALVIWSLAQPLIFQWTTLTSPKEEPVATEARVRWVQLALLALILVGAAGISLLKWRARRKGTVLPSNSNRWIIGLAGALILLYYGLELVIWRVYALAGLPNLGRQDFLSDIGSQSYLLPPLLLLLVYWGSTDLLEWSEIIAKSLIRLVTRPKLLVTVTALIAIGMLINELRLNGWSIFLGLALLVVIIALATLVVLFAQIRSDWPAKIPPLAFLLGAIVLYLQFAGIPEVMGSLALAHGLVTQEIQASLYSLMDIPVLLVALTTGLILATQGRLGKPKQGAIGLFLVMVVLLDVNLTLPDILNAAGFPIAFLQQRYSVFASLKFFAAVGALVWIGFLLVRRRALKDASKELSSVFLLLAGLQAIDWLMDLANGISTLGASSTVLLAGLFLLTTLWDLVTSGEQFTANSAAFPSGGRILLYLGSTLMATSLLLYIGSLRAQTLGAPAPDYFSTDSDAFLGLFLLGAPMVVLTFLLSVRQRFQRPATVAAVPTPARRVSPRIMQIGIGGSGVLALALAIVFIIVSALPRLVHTSQMQPNQTTYTAKSPGPDCAPSGATWNVLPDGPSLRCLPQGTQVTVPPKKLGAVAFLSPAIWQIQNYRVSVLIDFSSFPDGCFSLLTRFSETASTDYENEICANGIWRLGRTSNTFTTLAYGKVALARTYTLEAAADGPKQSLTINGIEMASVTDGTSTDGSILLAVHNASTTTESVVLSDFSFTSLPRSTSTTASLGSA